MDNAHALPRSRRIRPPHWRWWIAVGLVAACLGSLALHVAHPQHPVGTAVGIAAAIINVVVWWPSLRSPYNPTYPPPHLIAGADVALLASIATQLMT